MTDLIISMEEKYIDRVLCIERTCFRDPWPASAFLSELRHPWSHFRLVGSQGKQGGIEQVKGFVIFWMLPGDLHLLNLAVVPDHRRHGIGTMLIRSGLDDFAKNGGGLVSLEVRASNLAAKKMYLTQGFKVVGCRPGYYRKEKEDAIVMTKKIARARKIRIADSGN
ncbi:MAG: ribosomal protein S18-alanine N-acetyltransferase [Deltaproteobacteria bacterium]|nr:ribosomal protein S18-alanine N-acetyltransferase [Deltaproteobacteria bacterium]